jgi:hypothetical protein
MDWLAVFSLVGSGFLILMGFAARGAAKKFAGSKDWPTTDGKITSSKIHSSSSQYGTVYSVDICYEYSVNGISHPGADRVAPDGDKVFVRKERAREYVSAHPPKTPVLVYYDPNNPQIATHQPGEKKEHVVMWVAGVALAGFGFCRILGFFD